MLGLPGLVGPNLDTYATKVLAFFVGHVMGLHKGRQHMGQQIKELTFTDLEHDDAGDSMESDTMLFDPESPWAFQDFLDAIANLDLDFALDLLSPAQRTAVELAREADGEYGRFKELAEDRGLDPRTTSVNLSHARKNLRPVLQY